MNVNVWQPTFIGLIGALIPTTVATAEEPHVTPLERLFAQARDERGETYGAVRNALLAVGPEAAEFLRNKASAASDEQEQWLAEILFARQVAPEEFKLLERAFDENVREIKYGGHPIPTGKPPLAMDVLEGLSDPLQSAHPSPRQVHSV